MYKYFFLLILVQITNQQINAQSKQDSVFFTIEKYNQKPKNFKDAQITLRLNNRSTDTIKYLSYDIYYQGIRKYNNHIDTINLKKDDWKKWDIFVIRGDEFTVKNLLPGNYKDFNVSYYTMMALKKGSYQEKFYFNLSEHNKGFKNLETPWIDVIYNFDLE